VRRTLLLLAFVAALGLGLRALAAAPSPSLRVPDQLRVTGVASTSLTLRWRDRARGESRYQVRYRRAAAKLWRYTRRPRNARTFRHRGLRANAHYVYAVRACADRRCSRWSRALRVRTLAPGVAPSPPSGAGASIGGCPVFPADNAWNRDVSGDPVDANSDRYIAAIGSSDHLHPDFGANPDYGIPYVIVGADQGMVPIDFTEYGDESDPGPYPVPPDAPVEAGGDRHVLVVQRERCRLYELFHANYEGGAQMRWSAGAGAVFDLRSNALRPAGWTSADAAGLPILPGLVRYDEVAAGSIRHALRFTVSRTQRGYVHPARHFASSSTDPARPPMGLRLRLKASFDTTRFPPHARTILSALKTYGMLLADNGSDWFISGATDRRWDDDQLNTLKTVPGSAFEVVKSGPITRD
jgi:hypothetical protein